MLEPVGSKGCLAAFDHCGASSSGSRQGSSCPPPPTGTARDDRATEAGRASGMGRVNLRISKVGFLGGSQTTLTAGRRAQPAGRQSKATWDSGGESDRAGGSSRKAGGARSRLEKLTARRIIHTTELGLGERRGRASSANLGVIRHFERAFKSPLPRYRRACRSGYCGLRG